MSWTFALGVIAVLGAAFVLVPMVLRVVVVHDGDGAPHIRAEARPLLGLVGVVLDHDDGRTRVGPTVGRWTAGPWFPVGAAAKPSASEADAPPDADGSAAAEPAAGQADDEAAAEPTAASSLVARLRRIWALARAFGRPLVRLVRACPSAFEIRHLTLEGRLGLADPATTGALYGLLQGLAAMAPPRLRLRLTPDFVAPGTRGRIGLRVHFWLGRLLLSVLRFAVVAGWRALRLRFRLRRAQPTIDP